MAKPPPLLVCLVSITVSFEYQVLCFWDLFSTGSVTHRQYSASVSGVLFYVPLIICQILTYSVLERFLCHLRFNPGVLAPWMSHSNLKYLYMFLIEAYLSNRCWNPWQSSTPDICSCWTAIFLHAAPSVRRVVSRFLKIPAKPLFLTASKTLSWAVNWQQLGARRLAGLSWKAFNYLENVYIELPNKLVCICLLHVVSGVAICYEFAVYK